NLTSELPFAIAHTGYTVFMKDGKVLECINPRQVSFYDRCGFSHNTDFFRGYFANNPGGQGGTRERDPVEQRSGQSQCLTHGPYSIFSELYKRFKDFVSEGGFRINAK